MEYEYFLKQILLTHKSVIRIGQSGPENNGNDGVLLTFPKLKPCHQVLFSIKPRTPTFIWEFSPLNRWLSPHILCLYQPLSMRMIKHKVNILSGVLQNWIQNIFFSSINYHWQVKGANLPYKLPTDGGKVVWCIRFPRAFGLCEMQTASVRFWTWVTVYLDTVIAITP